MRKKTCLNCGIELDSDRPEKTKYCSTKCRQARWGRDALRSGHLIKINTDKDRAEAHRYQELIDARKAKNQNRRLKEQIVAADRIVEAAKDAMGTLPTVRVAVIPHRHRAEVSDEEALLLLTDHHIGAKFTLREMGGLNQFDINEYSRRLKHVVTSTVRFLKGRTDISVRRLVIFLGGDMIDGLIHDSLERNADVSIADQVVIGAHLLSLAIRDLSAEFPEIQIACAPGNHGRFRKPHEAEAVTQNFDTLLYVLLRQRLEKQPNIKWSIPREFWNYQQLAGHGVLLLHGHVGIRGFTGNATYPGYGLRRSVDNLQHILKRLGRPVQYIAMGHFHSFFSTSHEDGLLTINGSIVGANPYGLASGFPYRPAVQVLQTFNKKYGMSGQHLITPEFHSFGEAVPYAWERDNFEQ